ncbi:MAG: hypothetical protein EHM14_06520 [Methanothrix sp.]|nr:MAG: hypothetical protein EHM14_06520 [Methanothrix sp.]
MRIGPIALSGVGPSEAMAGPRLRPGGCGIGGRRACIAGRSLAGAGARRRGAEGQWEQVGLGARINIKRFGIIRHQ